MLALSEIHAPRDLSERVRDVHSVTGAVFREVIGEICRRFPSAGPTEKTARIERLIESAAWTDAALALIDLELPEWQLRRLAYDDGEWHCALSRRRELPEWLDDSIEGRHADLPLAIVSALVDAKAVSAPAKRTSVPIAPRNVRSLHEPVCCDNFC